MVITGRTAGEDLRALEDVLHAVRRVDHIALREVVPHVTILVVPFIYVQKKTQNNAKTMCKLQHCPRSN